MIEVGSNLNCRAQGKLLENRTETILWIAETDNIKQTIGNGIYPLIRCFSANGDYLDGSTMIIGDKYAGDKSLAKCNINRDDNPRYSSNIPNERKLKNYSNSNETRCLRLCAGDIIMHHNGPGGRNGKYVISLVLESGIDKETNRACITVTGNPGELHTGARVRLLHAAGIPCLNMPEVVIGGDDDITFTKYADGKGLFYDYRVAKDILRMESVFKAVNELFGGGGSQKLRDAVIDIFLMIDHIMLSPELYDGRDPVTVNEKRHMIFEHELDISELYDAILGALGFEEPSELPKERVVSTTQSSARSSNTTARLNDQDDSPRWRQTAFDAMDLSEESPPSRRSLPRGTLYKRDDGDDDDEVIFTGSSVKKEVESKPSRTSTNDDTPYDLVSSSDEEEVKPRHFQRSTNGATSPDLRGPLGKANVYRSRHTTQGSLNRETELRSGDKPLSVALREKLLKVTEGNAFSSSRPTQPVSIRKDFPANQLAAYARETVDLSEEPDVEDRITQQQLDELNEAYTEHYEDEPGALTREQFIQVERHKILARQKRDRQRGQKRSATQTEEASSEQSRKLDSSSSIRVPSPKHQIIKEKKLSKDAEIRQIMEVYNQLFDPDDTVKPTRTEFVISERARMDAQQMAIQNGDKKEWEKYREMLQDREEIILRRNVIEWHSYITDPEKKIRKMRKTMREWVPFKLGRWKEQQKTFEELKREQESSERSRELNSSSSSSRPPIKRPTMEELEKVVNDAIDDLDDDDDYGMSDSDKADYLLDALIEYVVKVAKEGQASNPPVDTSKKTNREYITEVPEKKRMKTQIPAPAPNEVSNSGTFASEIADRTSMMTRAKEETMKENALTALLSMYQSTASSSNSSPGSPPDMEQEEAPVPSRNVSDRSGSVDSESSEDDETDSEPRRRRKKLHKRTKDVGIVKDFSYANLSTQAFATEVNRGVIGRSLYTAAASATHAGSISPTEEEAIKKLLNPLFVHADSISDILMRRIELGGGNFQDTTVGKLGANDFSVSDTNLHSTNPCFGRTTSVNLDGIKDWKRVITAFRSGARMCTGCFTPGDLVIAPLILNGIILSIPAIVYDVNLFHPSIASVINKYYTSKLEKGSRLVVYLPGSDGNDKPLKFGLIKNARKNLVPFCTYSRFSTDAIINVPKTVGSSDKTDFRKQGYSRYDLSFRVKLANTLYLYDRFKPSNCFESRRALTVFGPESTDETQEILFRRYLEPDFMSIARASIVPDSKEKTTLDVNTNVVVYSDRLGQYIETRPKDINIMKKTLETNSGDVLMNLDWVCAFWPNVLEFGDSGFISTFPYDVYADPRLPTSSLDKIKDSGRKGNLDWLAPSEWADEIVEAIDHDEVEEEEVVEEDEEEEDEE